MSHDSSNAAVFSGLIDLVSDEMGGKALATNDDFFAGIENLTRPGRGVFIADKFTDRGKWMDGWESRRRREPGHDWCVLKLGVPGVISAIDVDTNHFLGNHAPFAHLEGTLVDSDEAVLKNDGADVEWSPIVPQSPCRPGSQNLFLSVSNETFSHVRLHIYPDGGVARLRLYGRPSPKWDKPVVDEATKPHHRDSEVDLAAVVNGGRALACSDAFFGPMNNLLLPTRAVNMGGGWETRRKRQPGNDWIIIELGARGTPSLIEVDTNHFKGNFPDRCSIDGIDAADMKITDLIAADGWWPVLGETKLKAHDRRFIRDALVAGPVVTHIRLNIFPCGGVSRLRLWGTRATQ